MGQFVIVAADEALGSGIEGRREFTVLTVAAGIDDGYIEETIRYGGGEKVKWEHSPFGPTTTFSIGRCEFTKQGDNWYFVLQKHKYRIVHGAEALEAYGSGRMFRWLYGVCPAD